MKKQARQRLYRNLLQRPLAVTLGFLLVLGDPQVFRGVFLVAFATSPVIEPLPNVTGIVAGTVGGSFAVSETGSATYRIDLAVPPGTGGVAPDLSLAYESSGRNGLLGVGWSMTGLSAVSRCPTTLAQDGFIDGVDFDGNDKFCLDGQRLVAVSGAYGADGTEYRTENESFSQVFSYGSSGNGPERFVARLKNGLTYSYGVNADSRVEAEGRVDVLLWQVDRIQDSVGNFMALTYQEDNSIGESYPLRIDYTGNTGMGLTPYNSVEFEYEARSDDTPRLLGGSKVKLTKRLKKIRMYAGLDLAWVYELTYAEGASTGRSRLTRIEECGGDGDCLGATSFEWILEGADGTFSKVNEQTSLGAGGELWSISVSQAFQMDLNGDGLTDLLQIRKGDYRYQALLSQGDGKFTKAYEQNNYPSDGDVWRVGSGSRTYVGDFNGDGLADLIQIAGRHYRYQALFSNGDGTFTQAHLQDALGVGGDFWKEDVSVAYPMDFNGDGRTDIIQVHTSKYRYQALLSNGDGTFTRTYQQLSYPADGDVWRAAASQTYVGDFNGDGLSDLIQIAGRNYRYQALFSNGDGTFTQANLQDSLGVGGDFWKEDISEAYPMDFNGDGLTDIVQILTSAYRYQALRSNGDGTFEKTYEQASYPADGDVWRAAVSQTYVGDFNGDGLSDLMQILGKKYRYQVLQSTGEGRFPQVHLQDSLGVGGDFWKEDISAAYPMDLDGDGLTDIVQIINNDHRYQAFSSNSFPLYAIRSITNGQGHTTTVEFKPLTDDSFYTKDTDAVYPLLDLQAPRYVVSAYEQDNGVGGTARLSYRYAGLKVQLDGRGFCGFRELTVIDETTGIATTTFYRQDHPYKSMAFKKETRLSDGTLINRTEDTWSVTHFADGGYFPHVTQSVVKNYELDGSLVNTSTTSKVFDDFGNPMEVTVSQSDGHTETTLNTYVNDTSNWFLGRLSWAEVTKQAPGQAARTRVSSFVYNATTGLLIEENTEPDHPSLWLKKSYLHDGYGNILQSTTTGPGIEARSQTTSYDGRGQFAISSTNALGHSDSKAYDPRHGKVVSATGPNNLTTTWQYDSFGRQIHELRADGTETRTLYYEADAQSPAGAEYYVRTDNSGSTPLILHYDLLDREIRRETLGFDGTRIFTDRQYNDRGELERVSDPYFEGDSPVWTVNEYDDLGRVTQVTAPGNRISTTTYSGFTTTVTNPLGQTNTRTVNSIGQLVESRDNLTNTVAYTYDSFGNLIRLQDPAGNLTTMQYDLRGNKNQMDDPDSGITTYVYDTLGQLIVQTDAKQQSSSFEYDKLGRLVRRTEAEGVSAWTYDSASKGIGKLADLSSPGNHQQTLSYDALGRLSSTVTTIDTEDFTVSQNYDQYGRLEVLTYPSGFAVEHDYNSLGYLTSVTNASTLQLYWQANTLNARGQLESESLGNGLTTTRVYDALTGFVESTRTGIVQDLAFGFDAIGNLIQRQDLLFNATEDFTYDGLNRLTQSEVVGGDVTDVTYDILGNITSMSNVGSYTYGENGAGPHAVTTINGALSNSYAYDANGNRTSSAQGIVTYSSFNKPVNIARGSTVMGFEYDANRDRFKQTVSVGGVLDRMKLYVGGIYERETQEARSKEVHYIRGGESTVAIYTTETGLPDKTRYLHKDHLGSIQTISDEYGNAVEVLSFDAWGNRRNADWSRATGPIISEIDRGFTGHEQLDEVGLIHMNGRVYDPTIGRFLSPDPNIQAPENTQNLNRYSYVLNNPLSFTDPSGFFFKKIFKAIAKFISNNKVAIIGAAVGIAIGFWVSGGILNSFGFSSVAQAVQANATSALFASAVGGGFAGGFAGAAASTIAAGGSLSDALRAGAKGGFFGGVTGGVFNKIGGAGLTGIRKIVAHGTAGGVLNLAQGGKFEHGFISSGTVAAVAPFIDSIGDQTQAGIDPYRTAAAAVVGGAVAEISGGKFVNGAITSAFARMFNDGFHPDDGKALETIDELNDRFAAIGVGETLAGSAFPKSRALAGLGKSLSYGSLGASTAGLILEPTPERAIFLLTDSVVVLARNPYLGTAYGGVNAGVFLGENIRFDIGKGNFSLGDLIGVGIAAPIIQYRFGANVLQQEMRAFVEQNQVRFDYSILSYD